MKHFSKIQYEFKELELKIYRLKKIEKELNALDIKGFESDSIKIKSRLKDLDMVDKVEKEFILLKNKINEKKKQDREQCEENEQKEKERERNEIKSLIYRTESIIKKAILNAINAKNSLWLSALINIRVDFQNFSQKFEIGKISHIDAKSSVLYLKEQAEVLSTPPEEEISEEAKTEETYYDILNVNPNVSQDEIRKAFYRKSLECHPDKIPSWADMKRVPKWVNEESENMFKKLNEANEVLSDPNKRREYDKKIGR